MNKGDRYVTRDGHTVVIEKLITIKGFSHPIGGWVFQQYPKVDWSKCCWTVNGKVRDEIDHPLDLNY